MRRAFREETGQSLAKAENLLEAARPLMDPSRHPADSPASGAKAAT